LEKKISNKAFIAGKELLFIRAYTDLYLYDVHCIYSWLHGCLWFTIYDWDIHNMGVSDLLYMTGKHNMPNWLLYLFWYRWFTNLYSKWLSYSKTTWSCDPLDLYC